MKNIDYRLDLFNAIRNYQDQMDDNDFIFALINDKIDGDLIIALSGDTDLFSSSLSINGLLQDAPIDKIEAHEDAKKVVLNAALNILNNSPMHLHNFYKKIKELYEY
jgi:hypothetical protein